MVEIVSIKKQPSPLLPDFLRLAAEIRFDGREPQTIWFDLPSRLDAYVSDRGEPWLLLLLPCAVVAGQDITLDLPVDPTLLYNLKGVQRIWQSWYPWLKPIEIEARALPNSNAGPETALFFSGGVDSCFSLLGAHPQAAADLQPSGLLMVWGFDIPLSKPDQFARIRELGEHVAAQFDKELIPVATNLMELDGYPQWWGDLSHGAALASIAHLLSNRFGRTLIGSSHDFSHLIPWSIHCFALRGPKSSTTARHRRGSRRRSESASFPKR